MTGRLGKLALELADPGLELAHFLDQQRHSASDQLGQRVSASAKTPVI